MLRASPQLQAGGETPPRPDIPCKPPQTQHTSQHRGTERRPPQPCAAHPPGPPLGGNGVIALGDIWWQGFFCFFFFPPLISPHLKKAPDRRRRLAAAHAGHRACSAPQDPQTPLLGIWEGGEGGASSPPPPLRLRISPHSGRRILTEAMPEGLRGGMGSRGGVEGGAARGAARHVYPHSGWESGPTELHPCGVHGQRGLPHTVPQGPATARTGLAESRLHTSCGRRGKA